MANLISKLFIKPRSTEKLQKKTIKEVVVSPGRVSVPDEPSLWEFIKKEAEVINPSFREEVIPLLRKLYKVNPDVGIALQDMFKLANTGHTIKFPYNTKNEAEKMVKFLEESSKQWGKHNSGMHGIINRMIVQCLIGGAISVEGVPNEKLNNLSTIIFINPENIRFKRGLDGVYAPYQKVKNKPAPDNLVELNQATYFYASMFNDIDEPYGIPTFMPSLDSLDSQHAMKENINHILEQAGLLGFLEAKMAKPSKRSNESEGAYIRRLQNTLRDLKTNIVDGMRDGVVTGYIDDHEFKLNATTKDLANVDKLWTMNQQSVANGLGVSSNILGIPNANTEGGAGILLSKMISQLRNVQTVTQHVIENIYELALLLGGFNCKGVKVEFGPSTVSDDLKIQQAREIKIRNNKELYVQGIISQEDYAWDMGYSKPYKDAPLVPIDMLIGKGQKDPKDKEDREKDKDKSDRKGRDKDKVNPKRGDQNPKER